MNEDQKTGRPKKKAAEALSARVAFRVTKNERSELETEAKLGGLSVSEYARARTIFHLKAVVAPKTKPKANVDMQAITELNRVGVNLSQITKHLNFGEGIPHDLSEAIAEVRAAVAKLAGSNR